MNISTRRMVFNVSQDDVDVGVLYSGINGFGITWGYFGIHMVLFFVANTGVVLNSLAVYALRTSYKTQSVDISHIFITNLACSDIIIDLTCIYTICYNLIHYKNYYECAFRNGLVTCVNLNSALHLLSLTIDRYFKITFPYKYVHLFKENWAKRYSACVWIFSGALSVLPVFGWRQVSLNGTSYCSYFGVMSKSFLLVVTSLFMAIFAVMLYCYSSIWMMAINKTRRIATSTCRTETKDARFWWRPTKTVLTLVLFYAVCWIPFGVVALLHLTDNFPVSYSNDQKGVLAAYCSFSVFLNTIFNPVIYVTRIKPFRIRIMTLFLSPDGKLYEKYISSKRIAPI